MRWELKPFAELSALELFEYLKLRQSVFVVEQTCPYPDIDDIDKSSYHLLGWKDSELVACARIIPAGISYQHPSIGRIASALHCRGSGIGRKLVKKSIDYTQSLFPGCVIKIGAQERLEKFYHSFGFETVSDSYIEDGIAHIEMLLDESASLPM